MLRQALRHRAGESREFGDGVLVAAAVAADHHSGLRAHRVSPAAARLTAVAARAHGRCMDPVLLAFLVDIAVGDPPWLYRRIPHPVAMFGRAGRGARPALHPGRDEPRAARRGGGRGACRRRGAGGLGHRTRSRRRALGMVDRSRARQRAARLRGLHDAVLDTARGLDTGLDAGRHGVRRLVGRDAQSLDEAGAARAAIESAGENLSDGVVRRCSGICSSACRGWRRTRRSTRSTA